MRQQHRRPGILQHEGEALRRIARIERQVGAAGLEDAEQTHNHLQRALDAQPDHDLWPDAQPAQMMRQLVGALFKLPIGQLLFLEHHRNCFGGSHRLRRKQLHHRRRRDRLHRVVPVPQQGLPLDSAEDVEPPDGTLRLRDRSLQQPEQTLTKRLDARPIKQVRTIVQPQHATARPGTAPRLKG